MKIVLILFSNNDVHKSIRIVRNVDSLILRLKNGACSNEIPYVIVGRRKYPFYQLIFLQLLIRYLNQLKLVSVDRVVQLNQLELLQFSSYFN